MKEKIISVCLIGAGSIAAVHAKSYNKNPNVRIAAVAARDKGKLACFCRDFKIKNYYTDYQEMFYAEKPEAVSVCTPTYTHAQITIDALRAGCHVLCEKPMAVDLPEADSMMAASKAAGKLLLVGFPLRYMNEYLRVKKVIESGELGRIKVIWFRRGRGLPEKKWYLGKNSFGGVATELAIHGVDLIRWLCQSPVISVSAEASDGVYNLGKEDNIWIQLKLKNGAMGIVGSSYSYPFFGTDFGISGDKKALRLTGGKILIADLNKKHTLISTFIGFCLESFIIPYRMPFEKPFDKEIGHFVDCILGKCSPALTAENGRANLEIVLSALESAKDGKRILIN